MTVEKFQLMRFQAAFELFTYFDCDVPAKLVQVFVYVCINGPCDKLRMERDLGITSASSKRIFEWMTPRHIHSKPGLDLVEKISHPIDGRHKMVRLTATGYKMQMRIAQILA